MCINREDANIAKLGSIITQLRAYRERNAFILARNARYTVMNPHNHDLIMQDVHVVHHMKDIDFCLDLLDQAITMQAAIRMAMPRLRELERYTTNGSPRNGSYDPGDIYLGFMPSN